MASQEMVQGGAVVFYTTWPDAGAAERCGRDLLARKLAACVNIGPEMVSMYRWRGEIESAREVVMLVKTTAAGADSAREALSANHPYETPCILAFDASTVTSSLGFLAWIAAETA